jgi:hypothetical protein
MTAEDKLRNAEIENRLLRAEIGKLGKALGEADAFGDFPQLQDKAKRLARGENS